jgi:S1-C subfamily serine protease
LKGMIMRKAVFLGISAAFLGAFSAIFWQWGHGLQTVSSAQETKPQGVATGPAAGMPASPGDSEEVTAADLQGLTPDEKINVFVYQYANRSVVNIKTKGVQSDRLLLFDIIARGEGSGLVLDKRGHILTNFHVVGEAQDIQVTLFDGNNYAARLIGGDPETDIAVLKIEAQAASLHPVTFGSSSRLLVGQRVFAIGNPFGLERTLTMGIIASLNRTLPGRNSGRSIKSVIQIDADINPGSSGGPLLDTRGRMIGMNTAIASKTGESAGVGFAIPVNTIARVVPQLITKGRVVRPESGIAKVYPTEQGLLVIALTPGGPAERAGMHGPRSERRQKRQGPFVVTQNFVNYSAADLIVAVDGRPVKTVDDFLDAVEEKKPGEQVKLSILREGRQQQIPLLLGTSEP